ncbi:MAG: 2'-5' RNA ligase family protein [Caldilineaceae bacterium]
MQAQYDRMWAEAQLALAGGSPGLDSHLPHKTSDRRRSATLLIRPSADTAAAVDGVLAELRAIEPDQYFYAPEELHVTVLSLFTGTEAPEPYLAQLPRYREAIDPVLAATSRFVVRFDGLTASPAAVLVQGYPEGSALEALRAALRAAIQAVGHGENLDRRYRITTAHMTAVRFCRPLRDPQRLAATLESLRRCDFGISRVAEIHLVENDWYMSQDRVSLLHTYFLR